MESLLTEQVCAYLRYRYPTVLWRTDGAGVNRSSWTAKRYARSTQAVKGWPDLQIVAKRGPYGALFLELKTERNSPYRKDGSLKTDPHVQEQAFVMEQLRMRGYAADFGIGFQDSCRKIDAYLAQ